jgi:hypothetical protein
VTITARLADALRKKSPDAVISKDSQVLWIYNAGDEGGIVCKASAGEGSESDPVMFASITQLDFGYRHLLSRKIRAYQEHRIKKLRRQNG